MAAMDSPLRKARRWKDLSLEEVSARVGIANGHLSKLERGISTPTPGLAAKLARYFAPVLNELHILYPERYPEWSPEGQESHTVEESRAF